jgi:hypothetical protein
MGRIEDQIKKQQLDRMFQEKMKQTLYETDPKEIMTELMYERQEEPEEHVDSHYEVKQEPVPSLDDDIDNRQYGVNISPVTYSTHGTISSGDTIVDNPGVGETTFETQQHYHYCDPILNTINTTTVTEYDKTFAEYVRARQEEIMQQEMEKNMMYEKSKAEQKVLQPRHTRHNDASTIFVYGCSDCPFMRKKAFENKILITCYFNPEQEFILEQGHSADELDNLMRNNCQLRKLIEIKIRFI